jgi:hypothetical protein
LPIEGIGAYTFRASSLGKENKVLAVFIGMVGKKDHNPFTSVSICSNLQRS